MSNNQKEVVQDLQFVAESLKEITGDFNQQPQNFLPIGNRVANVEDVEYDSDDDIEEKIIALEEQQRDVGEIPEHIRTIHEKTLDEIFHQKLQYFQLLLSNILVETFQLQDQLMVKGLRLDHYLLIAIETLLRAS